MDSNIFLKVLTYLNYKDIISYCSINKTYKSYSINPRYRNNWKNLIDDTYGYIYDYKSYLEKIWNDPNYQYDKNSYNYLVYVKLVQLLDPISQLMIYYKQDDTMFLDDRFNIEQRLLARILLGKKIEFEEYPSNYFYQHLIGSWRKIYNKTAAEFLINKIMVRMAMHGNVLGIQVLLEKGGDIHAFDDEALIVASRTEYLTVVKYLVEKGADINGKNGEALINASRTGYLAVVKYLVERGADIHARNEEALLCSSENGHLAVVKYLVERGVDIHNEDEEALRWASYNGHLAVVKYLVKKGADIHALNDQSLRWACESGFLDVVKYLIEKGADVHAKNDKALKVACEIGHLDVAKYLLEKGADVRVIKTNKYTNPEIAKLISAERLRLCDVENIN